MVGMVDAKLLTVADNTTRWFCLLLVFSLERGQPGYSRDSESPAGRMTAVELTGESAE